MGLSAGQVGISPLSRYSCPVPLDIVQETWLSRMVKPRRTNPRQLSEATLVGGMLVGVGGAGVEVTSGCVGGGVKANSPTEIQFTLKEPAAYFKSILYMWVGMPVRESDVTKGGEKWTEPATPHTKTLYPRSRKHLLRSS